MKKIFLITLFLFLFVFFLIPAQAQAAGLVPCGGQGEAACTFCDFFVLINNIIKFVMITLVPIVAVLMLVIGGVMFFFGGAKPDMLIQAKGIITSVVIGLVIIFCAWVIVNTVITKIGIVQAPSILQWYNIGCSTEGVTPGVTPTPTPPTPTPPPKEEEEPIPPLPPVPPAF